MRRIWNILNGVLNEYSVENGTFWKLWKFYHNIRSTRLCSYLLLHIVHGKSVPPEAKDIGGRGLDWSAADVKRAHDPIQELLDDDGGDVKEAVDAAATTYYEDEVCKAIQRWMRVFSLLGSDQISEAYGREGHKAEVEAIEVGPPFHRTVQERGWYGDTDGGNSKVQHHPIHLLKQKRRDDFNSSRNLSLFLHIHCPMSYIHSLRAERNINYSSQFLNKQ